MDWNILHKKETASTNLDARSGTHGDVFTADFQTAGRGRLDHKWLSAPGENLMMSAVLGVAVCPPEKVATLPLVVGLSVADAVAGFLPEGVSAVGLKWPNDVLCGGRKVAGILCERNGDFVIAGIGVNVNQRKFAPELEGRATSLALLRSGRGIEPAEVRDAVLSALGTNFAQWREEGFASLLPRLAELDCLRGRNVSVAQTDGDSAPATGVCGGIAADGSLVVGGERIYAGEAHVVGIW